MKLGLLPKGDAHEHVADIDHANKNGESPVGDVVLVDVDFGELLDEEMLESLEEEQDGIDQEQQRSAFIWDGREAEAQANCGEYYIRKEEDFVDEC
jgi:hypothetical protein